MSVCLKTRHVWILIYKSQLWSRHELGFGFILVFFFSFSFFYCFDFCKVGNDKKKITLILIFILLIQDCFITVKLSKIQFTFNQKDPKNSLILEFYAKNRLLPISSRHLLFSILMLRKKFRLEVWMCIGIHCVSVKRLITSLMFSNTETTTTRGLLKDSSVTNYRKKRYF